MKNGKLPTDKKNSSAFITFEEAFGGGSFDLPADVAKEFKDRNLTPRWLAVRELEKGGGFHKKGWHVYQRTSEPGKALPFGTQPDGTIRRNDAVLGYKTQEEVEKHRQYIRQRKRAQDAQVKAARQEAKAYAKQAGSEWLDDNED